MPSKSFFLIFPIVGIALILRLVSLGLRPMHTDEAVHAIKFGKLLEEGYYRYDRNEYHGPTLNYLTLVPARLLSQGKLSEVNEFTLRMVPAFFGAGLVMLLFLVRSFMRNSAWILSALFLAISPVMVYYSRYYIQEMLLVFFTYGFLFCFFRLMDSQKTKWAIWSGLSLGMMIATKETWISSFGTLMLTVLIFLIVDRELGIKWLIQKRVMIRDLTWMLLGAMLVSGIFYSSFFSNPQGIIDSFATYANYFQKAGDYEKHIHPWYFYVQLLIFNRSRGGIWTEAFLIIGALVGFVFALKRWQESESRFFFFIAIFSMLLGIIYSAMPYKTPWNLLTFYTGWIMLAAYGFSMILRNTRSKTVKGSVYLLLFIGLSQLCFQTWELNFIHDVDPSNPWAYGHTGKDVFRLVENVKQVTAAQPSGDDTRIDIVANHHDYWPLPWYLRMFPNTAWWDHVDMDQVAAPIMIVSPEFDAQILKKIYEVPPPGQRYLYLPLFEKVPELRSHVYLDVFIRKDAWDAWVTQSENTQ